MSATAEAGPPAAGRAPRPVPLRHNRGFQLLWIGQLLSDTGGQVSLIAYPLLVLALTGSPALAGVVGTAREVALICLQLPAGALSDRFDRRLTMIACDIVRSALLGVLAVLVFAHLASWPAVLAVGLIEGAAGGLFDPTASLPSIVAKEQLVEARAATEGRTWAASLAGPALGGVLFGLGRAVPFLADALAQGLNNKEVAARLYISEHTVAHHLRQAFRKLSIASRVELARIVIEQAMDDA